MNSQEGPKLYRNKPKKAQLKQSQEQKGKDMSSPSPTKATAAASSSSSSSQSAAAASYKMGSQSAPPSSSAPQPPKESFFKRNRFLVSLLLTANIVVGAYFFMRTKKKDAGLEKEATVTSVSTTAATNTAVTEKPTSLHPVSEPMKPHDPIPENQQRELFKWILEEKRKLKPKDPQEKKRIDEEKDILKQFIRAKSIPSI
uniref:Uncharacterized protein LOC105631469 n=1 Tax=Rhizophora mucronata TaxID=61149 RepID=A0A2P2Q5K7_RHIMU